MMSVRSDNWNMKRFRRSPSCFVERAAFTAICLRGAFPPVLFLPVCLAFAMAAQREVAKKRARVLKPHVGATHLAGVDAPYSAQATVADAG